MRKWATGIKIGVNCHTLHKIHAAHCAKYTLSQKKRNIFEVAFLLEKSVYHDPGSHDSDPGPQEKSMKKSCVSFETECRSLNECG